MNRREFLKTSALTGGSLLMLQSAATAAAVVEPAAVKSAPDARPARQLTVAGLQMLASRDVNRNETRIRAAIDQAAGVKADFLVTPEGSLSGYYSGFDRLAVAAAADRLAHYAAQARVGLILGTCYKELAEPGRRWDAPASDKRQEFCYDQVRVYAPTGEFLGAYSKILLGSSLRQPGTGEMRDYVGGDLRTFTWNGLCFGVLICNDLWATPGSTTIANPYLPWQLKKMGAELIFHPVSTGHVARYRPYHESNQSLWAWSLGIPIVTTNAIHDLTSLTNCRSGVVDTSGNRICEAPDAGEQFFSHVLPV